MTLAHVSARDPYLIRALKMLAARSDRVPSGLLQELAGITVLVAKKFTNDRTADGLLEAFHLTTGCVSLGLSLSAENDESRLNLLMQKGAEQVFQAGFRQVRELALMPAHCIVTEFDSDPYVQQRNVKALFFELCSADPAENWLGDESFRREMHNRQENQRVVACAKWLRRQHFAGPIKDTDLDANAVIAIAVIFAIAGDGRIVARTGQKQIENLVRNVREMNPDVEANWSEWLEKIPSEHRRIVAERIDEYRGTIVRKMLSKTALKKVVTEIQNYHAGIEQDVDYS